VVLAAQGFGDWKPAYYKIPFEVQAYRIGDQAKGWGALTYALLGLCVSFLLVNRLPAYALVKSIRSERAAMAAEILAGREQLKAERNQIEAERQRDEALINMARAQTRPMASDASSPRRRPR